MIRIYFMENRKEPRRMDLCYNLHCIKKKKSGRNRIPQKYVFWTQAINFYKLLTSIIGIKKKNTYAILAFYRELSMWFAVEQGNHQPHFSAMSSYEKNILDLV